ncbi:MAG: nuclease-related domain-containing protein [Bacillota bacterium]
MPRYSRSFWGRYPSDPDPNGDNDQWRRLDGWSRFWGWYRSIPRVARIVLTASVFIGLGPLIPIIFSFAPILVIAWALSRSKNRQTRRDYTSTSQPTYNPVNINTPLPTARVPGETVVRSTTTTEPSGVDKMLGLLSDDYVVMRNFTIRVKDKIATIDYLVLGANGIFAVQMKDIKGELVIEPGNWAVRGTDGRFRGIESPALQAKHNATVLQEWLKQMSGLENLPVHGVVCLTNSEVYIQGKDELPVVKAQSLPYFIETQEGSWPEGLDKAVIQQQAVKSSIVSDIDPFAAFAAMSMIQQNQFLLTLPEEERSYFVNANEQYRTASREERRSMINEFMTRQMMEQRFDVLNKLQEVTGKTRGTEMERF